MSSELKELLIQRSQTLVHTKELLGRIHGLIDLIVSEVQKDQEATQGLQSVPAESTSSFLIWVEDSAIPQTGPINPTLL
ncbi:hypothetical protein [Pseudanabaena sp. FACHB-2040]|uniref:hypothetical protein n=1 Tax=Pseudanabaena sp. FACHB-2040 TaxID=2692859 RepID=UPI001682ED2A|nr:hypothetical protein [Pseudanabaena sp. FACHB-2040]MBD2259403.1 hypothetical protein [Pseudanabaena sp. FACHB-2040]